jgi:hypothetical protein
MHLLVSDTKSFFKMHGATIKINFLPGKQNIIAYIFALTVMHATCATHLIRVYLIIVTMSHGDSTHEPLSVRNFLFLL